MNLIADYNAMIKEGNSNGYHPGNVRLLYSVSTENDIQFKVLDKIIIYFLSNSPILSVTLTLTINHWQSTFSSFSMYFCIIIIFNVFSV